MKADIAFCMLALVVLGAGTLLAGELPSLADLLDALESGNYQIRRKAVLAVEGRKEPELLDKVLEVADKDDHPNIRGYAADVLATFKDERVFPVLQTMATDDSVGPRQHAFVALGRLADPRCRKILLNGLTDQPSTAAYAAKGLGLHGDPQDFQVVATFFVKEQKNPYVAELTPEALDRIDGGRVVGFLLEQFELLVSYARRHAGKVLAKHPTKEVRVGMVRHLGAKDKGLRHAAITVLAGTRDPKAIPALIVHFDGPREDRAITAGALGRLRAGAAVPKLIPALSDADAGVRTSVVHALGQIGDRAAVRPIAAMLEAEKDGMTKIRAIEALGRFGDDRAIGSLVPCLYDQTYVSQPMTISSVWPYPWNTHIFGVAVWSIMTLRDGKEPFELSELMSFQHRPPPKRIAADVKAIGRWWKKASSNRRYRLPEK